MRIIKILLLGYLFFQSWTSAFAISPTMPIHVIICTVALLAVAIHRVLVVQKLRISIFKEEDFLIGLFLLFFLCSALVNTNGASLNYIAAYFYVFLLAYLGVKGAFYNYLTALEIKKWLLYGVLIVAITSIVEFFINFFTTVDLNTILFRIKEENAVYGGFLPRSLAFSSEPGILAFYFETLGVIGIWIITIQAWAIRWKVLAISIIVIGWCLTFSAASFAAVLLSSIIVLFVRIFKFRKVKELVISYLAIPISLIVIFFILQFASDTIFGSIISKITLSGTGSADMRAGLWIEGVRVLADNPIIGVGPGSAAAEGMVSNLSWYLFLAKEAGILSILPLFLFLIIKFARIINTRMSGKYWFLFAFSSGAIHLAVISTFFHPFLWTTLLLFEVLDEKNREKINVHY